MKVLAIGSESRRDGDVARRSIIALCSSWFFISISALNPSAISYLNIFLHIWPNSCQE